MAIRILRVEALLITVLTECRGLKFTKPSINNAPHFRLIFFSFPFSSLDFSFFSVGPIKISKLHSQFPQERAFQHSIF